MLHRSATLPSTVALALAVAACAPTRVAKPPHAQIGRQLELVAPDLAGREQDVGANQGTVRVVDFWASWCEPCRDAMPQLDRIFADLESRGLAVYAVAFDEDREQVVSFLRDTPVAFPVLWDKGGDRWSARYEVTRLPMTFLVDRKGVIRAVHDGWSPSKARAARRDLELLLDEPP